MNFLVRYLIQNAEGQLQQLGPEESLGDHPLLGFGNKTTVEGATYRVGSLPRMKRLETGELLYEVLLVSEAEYERTFDSGQVPIASIEPGFNPDGDTEWEFKKVV